jgi:hypothetical protein
VAQRHRFRARSRIPHSSRQVQGEGAGMSALSDALGPAPEPRSETAGKATITPEGGTFTNVTTDKPLETATDWTVVFERFNLDPTVFEILNDTVTMSISAGKWQQSKRLENGDRDEIWLHSNRYSYSARFKRKSPDALPAGIVNEWRKTLMRSTAKRAASNLDKQGTYSTKVSDGQLGKVRTQEAVANWQRGVQGHCNAIERSIEAKRSPEAVHVAFMGDETEGYANNYANQPHTIELNLSEQLALDYDMRVWTLKQFAQFGLPLSASSVISNHGSWTRNGGKEPVTTNSDNSSTFVARQVKALFDELAPHTGWNIDWTIGDGTPGVTITLSGVECYFSHGYIEKGRGTSTESRVRAAIERQILGKTQLHGTTKLWFMAHYHHFHANEFEGRTLMGCPALEAERSSEYMLDQFGVWSPPGMLGMLIDSNVQRGWTNLAVY